MINRAKLEDSFKMIGTKRIPVYIKLYQSSNKKFITLFDKYLSRQDIDKLSNLVHKTKGSTAIFCDEELDIILVDIENKILHDNLDFDAEQIIIMKTKFQEFWAELTGLKAYYCKK